MMHTRYLCCILLMAICSMGLSCHASSLYSPRDAFGAHYDFRWDDNGNLVNSHAHAPHTDRRLAWTEDEAAQSERRASLLAFPSQSSVGVANRLQAFMERGEEGGTAAYYNYSADGERNIKLTSPRMLMSQNASMYSNPQLIYPTLYASPLITLTQRDYTKHYFEEDRRVCSRLGGGFRGQIPDEEIDTKVEVLNASYENLFKQQQTGIHNTFRNCIGAKPIIYEMYDLRQMLREYVGDEKSYFYHSDHLGSAAYLTSGGDVTQTLNYLPYGEDWIDVQFNLDPRLGQYTFNGKEKDYESGFNYYGARYYWGELLTGWLSVDPMMDKYPGISPYNYCMWNPVKLIDPEGEKPVFYGLLQYQGKTKHGNDHVGETRIVGDFHVIPFYDNQNTLIGYNAGRFRSDGSYTTEYQMEPGDLETFSRNNGLYEVAANLVYCNGEPDWSMVKFGSDIFSGNVGGALSELGKMWGNALSDPSFYYSIAASVFVTGSAIPSHNNKVGFVASKMRNWIGKDA